MVNYEKIQEEAERKHRQKQKRKREKMKVVGKSVFDIVKKTQSKRIDKRSN